MKVHEQFKNTRLEEQADISLIMDSLEYLKGEVLVPRDVEDGVFNFMPLFRGDEDEESQINFYRFIKVERCRKIIGIDSSVIPIAESKEGFVLGLKGSMVSEFNHSYEVMILGPALIYISPRSSRIFTELLRYPRAFVKRASLDISYAKKLAVDVFETGILINALKKYRNSIFLIDGSLAGPSKHHMERLSHILDLAKLGENTLVGISKKSKFMKKYPHLYKIAVSYGVPGALEVPSFVLKKSSSVNVYISLFKDSGLLFRVDIPNFEDKSSVFNQIFSSPITSIGYPEVLKESHILSKISRFEILILRRYLEIKGAYFVNTERLRDMIFGAYNRTGRRSGDSYEGL